MRSSRVYLESVVNKFNDDARHGGEERRPKEPTSLGELLTKVVSSGGWDRVSPHGPWRAPALQILCATTALPSSVDVVLTVSEAEFLAGDLSRMTLRAECREYLLRAGLI